MAQWTMGHHAAEEEDGEDKETEEEKRMETEGEVKRREMEKRSFHKCARWLNTNPRFLRLR